MTIHVRLFATLRTGRGKTVDVEVEDNAVIRDILIALDIKEEDAAIKLINGRHHDLDSPIKPGDIVSLFPPVGGG